MKLEQLNIRLPQGMKQRIKTEAARFSKTNEIIARAAFELYFKHQAADRLQLLSGQPYARKEKQ